jgi:PAS domain S-box-containing protein
MHKQSSKRMLDSLKPEYNVQEKGVFVKAITESKEETEALFQSEEKFRLLFSNMMNGYAYCQMIFDEEGNPLDFIYLEINAAFEALTGLKKGEVVEKKVTEVIPTIKLDNPELLEIYGRVALTGNSERFESFFKSLNIWLSISVHSPKKGYFAAVFEDITEQKQIERLCKEYSEGLELTVTEKTKELIEAQERLLKHERLSAIGELAGIVSHDLRNPLAAIKNAIFVLRKTQGSYADKAEMLNAIDKAVEHANNIVNDLLDFSREIHLERRAYLPKSLVNSALAMTNIPENIKIFENTENQPAIWLDADKIERVFSNLIKNAIEAMPNGGILKIYSNRNGTNVDFTFSDTGNGMSAQVLEKIFTPLFTTKTKGMGLGLASCKRIIEAHSGRIAVESGLNKGTKFTVSLPIEQKLEESFAGNCPRLQSLQTI